MKRTIVTVTFAVLVAAVCTPPASAQDFRETITANAMAMGTSNPPIIPRGMRLNVQINITRWSTEEERTQILDAVRSGGQRDQESLRQTLRGMDEVGWVRVQNSRAVGSARNLPRETLRFSREYLNDDGSHRLILATDRPITFTEAQQRGRTWDFQTTLIILDLDDNGNGEGQLAMGVQLWFDDEDNLVINNFGSEPVRLLNARRR